MARGSRKAVSCPAEITLNVIRGRWKLLVLQELCAGVTRFGRLRRALTGITQKVLTEELRDLERDGLVRRKRYLGAEPRVEYSITALGKSMRPILEMMHEWGLRYLREKPVS